MVYIDVMLGRLPSDAKSARRRFGGLIAAVLVVSVCGDRSAAEPAIPLKDSVRGFVYDVSTGALREVTA